MIEIEHSVHDQHRYYVCSTNQQWRFGTFLIPYMPAGLRKIIPSSSSSPWPLQFYAS